jgi:hypothetical protein
VVLLSLLAACAPEPRVQPESGWYAVDAGETDWTCGANGPANGLRADGLVWVEVGESWRWADDTDPLPCVFDGLSFSCEVFDTGFAYAQTEHTDATVAWSARIEASWIDGETIEGRVSADYTCSGADCARIAPDYGDGFAFPCAALTPWTASFSGGP